MLAPVRTVAPAAPLITVEEAKAHCRVDTSDEDALITSLVSAATERLDGYSGILGRALITQTWRMDLPGFMNPIRLPVGNLQSVTGITYYDADDAQQTLSASVYAAFSDSAGPFIELQYGQQWPSVYPRSDAVRVTWTAGYGSAATDVPVPIKQAALLLVGHWYANREAVTVGAGATSVELPMGVSALIEPFRRVPI